MAHRLPSDTTIAASPRPRRSIGVVAEAANAKKQTSAHKQHLHPPSPSFSSFGRAVPVPRCGLRLQGRGILSYHHRTTLSPVVEFPRKVRPHFVRNSTEGWGSPTYRQCKIARRSAPSPVGEGWGGGSKKTCSDPTPSNILIYIHPRALK